MGAKLTPEELQGSGGVHEPPSEALRTVVRVDARYASEDPVFVAMNKKGNRGTNSKLGAFCINCHAPMALHLGLVDDSNAADFWDQTLKTDGAIAHVVLGCRDRGQCVADSAPIDTTSDHSRRRRRVPRSTR